MLHDEDRLRENIAQAETEDLLDRVTVYRDGMEPDALRLIERELSRRGVSAAQLRQHAQNRDDVLYDWSGVAFRCAHCRRPAVVAHLGWYMIWELLPLFPKRFYYCGQHKPTEE